jgi:hypothetical protein
VILYSEWKIIGDIPFFDIIFLKLNKFLCILLFLTEGTFWTSMSILKNLLQKSEKSRKKHLIISLVDSNNHSNWIDYIFSKTITHACHYENSIKYKLLCHYEN